MDGKAVLKGSKPCSHCGESKPLEKFPLSKKTRDGRGSWCKQCHRDYTRGRYSDRLRGHTLESAFDFDFEP